MNLERNSRNRIMFIKLSSVVAGQEIDFYIIAAETFSISLYHKSTLRIETYHRLCELTDHLVSLARTFPQTYPQRGANAHADVSDLNSSSAL